MICRIESWIASSVVSFCLLSYLWLLLLVLGRRWTNITGWTIWLSPSYFPSCRDWVRLKILSNRNPLSLVLMLLALPRPKKKGLSNSVPAPAGAQDPSVSLPLFIIRSNRGALTAILAPSTMFLTSRDMMSWRDPSFMILDIGSDNSSASPPTSWRSAGLTVSSSKSNLESRGVQQAKPRPATIKSRLRRVSSNSWVLLVSSSIANAVTRIWSPNLTQLRKTATNSGAAKNDSDQTWGC